MQGAYKTYVVISESLSYSSSRPADPTPSTMMSSVFLLYVILYALVLFYAVLSAICIFPKQMGPVSEYLMAKHYHQYRGDARLASTANVKLSASIAQDESAVHRTVNRFGILSTRGFSQMNTPWKSAACFA
jgi:hypothetical protein